MTETNRPLRVLMIGSNMRVVNGVASFSMNYMRHISPEEVQFDFASVLDAESPYNKEIEARGGHTYTLPPIKDFKAHMAACHDIIDNGHYDIIHDNTLFRSFPLLHYAKKSGVPVRILHSHSSAVGVTARKRASNAMLLPLMRSQCNVYLACSKPAAACMFGKRNVTLVPNAIDMKHFAPDRRIRNAVRKKLQVEDKVVVGSVGRLSPVKNPFFAMDVFKEFLKLCPNAVYWWIGTGLVDDKVKEYVKEIGISEQVKFLGSRSDVDLLYRGMDVFFMPSLYEGLPVTGIEAQAAHLPCVISDVVTREMEYSNLIHYVSLDSPACEWAKVMDEAVHSDVPVVVDQHRFDIDACADRLLQLYKKEVSKRK